MKAYQKQQQYIYCHCQLCCVTPSHALIVGVCILMLPVLELPVEIATAYHINWVNHVHLHYITYSHVPLLLAFLNNVLPAMVLQNRVSWSNIGCLSSHYNVCHGPSSPSSTIIGRLGKKVMRLVVLLLLMMSGDIETNPGPLSKFSVQTFTDTIRILLSMRIQGYINLIMLLVIW